MSTPESDDPSALIARAVLRLGRRLRAARPDKSVNLSTLALLTTLFRRGPMSAVQLAREERLQPQSLTRILAAMTREGLIAREPDPTDRRARLISLTQAGRTTRDQAQRDIQEQENHLLSRLPAADRKVFLRSLQTLWESVVEPPS